MEAACPVCGEGIAVTVHVQVCLSWRDAVRLRLAGPEARRVLLDELSLRMTEAFAGRRHPENE